MNPAFSITLGIPARNAHTSPAWPRLSPSFAPAPRDHPLQGGHTTAIEGNTPSEDEVAAILRRHSTPLTPPIRCVRSKNVLGARNGVLGCASGTRRLTSPLLNAIPVRGAERC